MMRRRLSYSNLTATVALFVALGGTSYAITKLPRNSVGSAQVRDRSLQLADLAASARTAGPRGPRGPVGPQGSKGEPGPRGTFGSVVVRQGPGVTIPNAGPVVNSDVALCDAGEVAVGGGARVFDTTAGANQSGRFFTYVVASFPVRADKAQSEAGETPRGWSVEANNESGSTGSAALLRAYTLCAR